MARGRADLLAALPAWITARLIVAATLVAAHYASHRLFLRRREGIMRHLDEGLLGWDAERYREIAVAGYAALPRQELRFFPLWPLLARALAFVTRLPVGFCLLVIANVAALVLGALVHRLVLHETHDDALARRATWLAAITPAGFVLAWGYSEALWGCFAVAAFLALRSKRWWIAALAAFAAGLTRPVASLLAVPAAIETVRDLRTGAETAPPPHDLVARLAAVGAAPAGTCLYLAWVWSRFGDPMLPFRIQQSDTFRGGFANPFAALYDALVTLVSGDVTGDALRVPWAIGLVALLVVTFKRWPASYGAFAAASLFVALGAQRLGSFERYAFTTFPFVLTLALLARREDFFRGVVTVAASTMALYGTLALLGAYTP